MAPMARLVVIDNYDSFTYNLVQYFEVLGASCQVFYNDATDAAAVRALDPDGIVLSPGPRTPDDAGICLSLIREAAGKIPVLGVCLGHQAIGQAFGGKVVRAGRIMHGKTSPIEHDGRGLYEGIELPFTATRYHSLIVERESLPDCLEISAWTREGEIMGLRHREIPVEGLQYHPESILTARGLKLLENWLRALPARRPEAAAEASRG
jgi:anthranilate synthase/aminodeoxychorismate synthase-like glutamine amidotransferase